MRSLEMIINDTSDEILSPMTSRWRVEAEGTDDNLSGSGANACASSSRRNYIFFGPEDAYRSRLRKFKGSYATAKVSTPSFLPTVTYAEMLL